MYRYGSLFAGAGLFDYGLHTSVPDLDCRFAFELDAARRRIFGVHFPGVELHADIEDAPKLDLPEIDGLIGGIPCNLFSTANTSSSNTRDIAHGPAKHALQLISELRPKWTLWESSAKDGSWRRWVPAMRRELWRRKHSSLSVRMRTAPRGSAHDRERAFILSWRSSSDPYRDRESSRAIHEEVARLSQAPVHLWNGKVPARAHGRVAHGCEISLARAIGLGVDQNVARDIGCILKKMIESLAGSAGGASDANTSA